MGFSLSSVGLLWSSAETTIQPTTCKNPCLAPSMHSLFLTLRSLLLSPLLQAFSAAAQALDPSTDDPAALSAARATLFALLATQQPLSDKLAALGDLAGALQTLQAAGTTGSYIPDAVAALTAVRGVALSVGAIAATLRALQGNYSAAAPCIRALLGRAQHVNTSVLLLPPEIDRPAALLADAQVGRLRGALGGALSIRVRGLCRAQALLLQIWVPAVL